MSKKNKEKEEKKKEKCTCGCGDKCECDDTCTCGCHEGKECTCDCNSGCDCGSDCDCGCQDGEPCKCNDKDNETITLLSNRIKELEDNALRAQAELLNYRKRKDEETARILKYAEEDILKGFLPILDNFERAITMDDNNFGDETSKFLEGFRIVYNQTKELLARFEVKEIECVGKEFDPGTSQAISIEKDKTKPSGVVLKVYQKGYMYKDKVLRHAMVIVNE